MLTISFKATFVKQVNKLEKALTDEIFEKIKLLKNKKNHKTLKVHKLHGKLSNCFSFSVNYNTRIVFEYLTKGEIVLLFVGSHDIYK
ncbi:MAG: plasmid stabilization protein [Patescibacteria group bacterium]